MALMCLLWFAFLRVGEAASIRGRYLGGESSWFVGHKKRDYWPEMAPVV